MNNPKRTILVIGAGVAGLAAARRLHALAEKEHTPIELRVLEASDHASGVIATESRDGFLLEQGPDSFLSENPRMLELCRELGIENELIGTQARHQKTLIVHNGRLVPLPQGFYLIAPQNIPAFLATPLFSASGKARMIAEYFVPRLEGDTDESVASFIRRRFGEEALERVGQPMIAGVYSGDPEKLSILSTMPRFRDAERLHGSVLGGLRRTATVPRKVRGPRYSLFLSFKNGMRTLTDALERSLPAGALRTGFKTVSLTRDEASGQWTALSDKGESVLADAVCLAVPARVASKLLGNQSTVLCELLSQIRYESVATVNLAFEDDAFSHPLNAFGFVVPRSQTRSLMACTFAHRKFAGRAPLGGVLLRAFAGGAFGKRFFEMSDPELSQNILHDLESLAGLRKKPLFSVVSRYPDALAQYEVGHARLLSRIDVECAAFPGLELTGASYRGTGIPDCIRDGERAAQGLWE